MEKSNIIILNNKTDYNNLIKNNRGKLILILFYLDGCGPCKMFKPIYAELSNNYNNVVFAAMEANAKDSDQIRKEKFNDIQGFPSVRFVCEGNVVCPSNIDVSKFTGSGQKEDLVNFLNTFNF